MPRGTSAAPTNEPPAGSGYRERLPTTQAGNLSLDIPKLRQGSFFPHWLEPRRRVDKAIFAVVVEALGGASGISKSEASRILQALGT